MINKKPILGEGNAILILGTDAELMQAVRLWVLTESGLHFFHLPYLDLSLLNFDQADKGLGVAQVKLTLVTKDGDGKAKNGTLL